MIYLTHPQHGAKYAYLEAEAQADETNGWVRSGEPAADFADVSTAPAVFVRPDFAALYTEKFGKPPHHRMKPETIKAALDGNS